MQTIKHKQLQPSDHCQQVLFKNLHEDISQRDLKDGSALRALGALAEDLGSQLLVTPGIGDPQPLLYSSNTCTYVAYSLLQIYMNINK